ncbi:hypothetical protein VP5_044 [Vibrio virus VPMCC5]|nr:hypothetical protein VP5_044 [Vibrio virus VPMCC5]
MFTKNIHIIRGYTKGEVEEKVEKFLKKNKRFSWEVGDIEHNPAKGFLFKPYSCILYKD